MSNVLRKIKRNRAKTLGLPVGFFCKSFQEHMKRAHAKRMRKWKEEIAKAAQVQPEALSEPQEESDGGEV